jgi:speckle-type POZ protein
MAMLTTDMQEASSSKIIVGDIDGETMLELLRFIYTNEVENIDEIAKNLIYAAEKYDLPELKALCASKLIDQIADENVSELLHVADGLGEQGLFRECMNYIAM